MSVDFTALPRRPSGKKVALWQSRAERTQPASPSLLSHGHQLLQAPVMSVRSHLHLQNAR
jgi:hypothetical protein